MAKKGNGGGIAAMVGRELGKLAARKDALARELAGIESQIASVRDSVAKALGPGRVVGQGRKAAKAAVKHARKALSPETRAKMAAAAKARWAKAKKAGQSKLG